MTQCGHACVTEPVTIVVDDVGHEADLFGQQRRGFAGTVSFAFKDYRIDYGSGLASQEVEVVAVGYVHISKRATAIQPVIS